MGSAEGPGSLESDRGGSAVSGYFVRVFVFFFLFHFYLLLFFFNSAKKKVIHRDYEESWFFRTSTSVF